MRSALLTLLSLLLTTSIEAIHTGPVPGDRIGVLETPGSRAWGAPSAVRKALPRYLRAELERAGFFARIIDLTVDELASEGPSRSEDFYVEAVYDEEGGGPIGGVGTGGRIGDVGIGAEVSIVAAEVGAEIRLYDGRTMELLDSFVLHAGSVSPALTGLGLGGRHGYFFFAIPFLANQPWRQAAREIARETVERLKGAVPAPQE